MTLDLLSRYGPQFPLLYTAVLADVLDSLGHRHCALPSNIRPLDPEDRIYGRAATLLAGPAHGEPDHPYALELECVDLLRQGEVLVATTQGDVSSALWGELLSTAAFARGAAGVVLDGLTRDVEKILAMDFPVFASGFSPLDSRGRIDAVAHGCPIPIGNCTVSPGDWIFGDCDGVVVVPASVAEMAIPKAIEKVAGENQVRAELARGRSAREVFAEYGIL